jgi:3-oxoacyl-[acyl-carrier-protein] synthase II
MMERRVVITGLGVISPLGIGHTENWEALLSGRSGVREITATNCRYFRTKIGGEVHGFQPQKYITQAKNLKLMSRPVSLGVVASALAYSDSGLKAELTDPLRLGAFIGSRGHASDSQELVQAVTHSMRDGELDLKAFGAQGISAINPMWLLRGLSNIVLYFVSLNYNSQGINANICSGGISGTQAIGEAFKTIKANRADVAFAGGYDSLIEEDRLEMYDNANLISTAFNHTPEKASRPFDAKRNGFVPAEGAAFLMLEELSFALRRNANIYAEVVGYGTCSAASILSGYSTEGFASVMRLALKDAGISPGRVDGIFAHGLATPVSDRAETAAIKEIFAERASRLPVSAIKSMIGNNHSASGAIEAVAATLALQNGVMPPTINYEYPDPDCDLDYVPRRAREVPMDYVLLNNCNFGGGYGALVLKKWKGK